MALGGDPARFWELTPRLYSLEIDGLLERQRAAKSLAWYVANRPYLKSPPGHDDFVRPKKRMQSPDQMLLIAQCWDQAVNSQNAPRKVKA